MTTAFRSPSLPDELVKQILSPLFLVSDSRFFDMNDISPFSAPSISCSTYLLVCKQWLRVSTPLLYHCVIIRSKAQAQALERSLLGNTILGRQVKQLRVEGGFGMPMNWILKRTWNVVDLVLSLMIMTPDSVSGIKRSLGCLTSVKRLGVLGEARYTTLPSNRAALDLATTIAQCVQQTWKTLGTFYCGWDWKFAAPHTATIVREALRVAPMLHSMHLHTWFFGNPDLTTFRSLLAYEALTTVSIGGTNGHRRALGPEQQETLLNSIPELKKLVHFVRPCDNATAAEIPQAPVPTTAAPIAASSSVPLEKAPENVQDVIWSRILYFAADADYVYTDSDLEPGSPTRTFTDENGKTMSLSQIRFQFVMVSRRFQRLAQKYMYRDVELDNIKKIINFAALLLNDATIGATVGTLVISGLDFHDDVDPSAWSKVIDRLLAASVLDKSSVGGLVSHIQETAENELIVQQHVKSQAVWRAPIHTIIIRTNRFFSQVKDSHLAMEYIFSKIPNLIKLTCSWNRKPGQTDPPSGLFLPFWREITRLQGTQLQSLDIQLRMIPNRSLDLLKFTKLRFLALRHPYFVRLACTQGTSVIHDQSNPVAIPIERFTYENDTSWNGCNLPDEMILRPLLAPGHSFPAIKQLHMKLAYDSDRDDPCTRQLLQRLLQTCGNTLEELCFTGRRLMDLNLFKHCRSLRSLSLDNKSVGAMGRDGFSRLFACSIRQTLLEKVHITTGGSFLYPSPRVFPVFILDESKTTTRFSDFPALKEIQVDECEWPNTERQIQGNHRWVEISERLRQEFGIKLTDKKGVHWIPRLQVERRRRA